MGELSVGKIIRIKREKYKISQSRLCKGLCSVSMLSKIESGERYPSRMLYNALLERIGESEDDCNVVILSEDSDIAYLREQIMQTVKYKNYEAFYQATKKFEDILPSYDHLNRQFLYEMKSTFCNGPEEKMECLYQAIRTTIPDFELIHILDYLLSNGELRLISNIACCYMTMNDISLAFYVFQTLISYMKQYIKTTSKSFRIYPSILSNYIHCAFLLEEYDKVMASVDEGIDICIKYELLDILPNYYYHKCVTYAKCGRIDEVKELTVYTYYMCHLIGQVDLADRLRKSIEEITDIDFIMEYECELW